MKELLYAHNAAAYRAVTAMLAEEGKAAVIHPTGTGKSFIAFQLCADFPARQVCWLSPSEYIFRTQMDNWQAAGGASLEQIQFLTYAKLMTTGENDLAMLRPDIIILDEFHRCGAQQWGKGVQRLLAQYPQAKVLGLSATNVRYLDNQRDMAQELFGGCIASEMTLGEAVARGILRAPRYVLTAYRLQKSLKKYEYRLQNAKSRAVREHGETILQMLRRALEQADGLERVFEKHLHEHSGKYLAFCANAKHMDEMIAHVPEWFGGVDPQVHVYRAYSEDPATSLAFANFKEDSSKHLKLLFCIDMLNEGIHVADVSGVILFRPTVSPIVYKQQIGRALSAGRGTEPVIIDVVNNVENLCSIGALEQEMEETVQYFRTIGENAALVTERFTVIDEVHDCRRLFEALEETLTAPWEVMYQYAKAYYKEHGHLRVPRRYRTAQGYGLGNWIMTQRQVRSGRRYGNLDAGRIAKLDAIGMVWEDQYARTWHCYYAALQAYHQAHGSLDMPVDYVTAEGLRLGAFITHLRAARASGSRNGYLTGERIQQLNKLGMIWDKLDYQWERNYLACSKYYIEHHDLDVPSGYISDDGLKIGAWVNRQRRQRNSGNLTEEQIRRLDAIGMLWKNAYDRRWDYGYQQAVRFFETYGHLAVPASYVNDIGFPLGKWLKRHTETDSKTGRCAVRLTPERKAKLDAIGMIWKSDAWEKRYALAQNYYEQNGNLRVPSAYRPEGIWLGKWLNEQKQIYHGKRKGKTLRPEQIAKLEAIGMVWEKRDIHNDGEHAASKNCGAP